MIWNNDIMMVKFVKIYLLIVFYLLVSVLTIYTLFEYEGTWYIYLLFSILSNALLYYGFRSGALFFDVFIGIFFWFGFWFKASVRIAFLDGRFHVGVGGFDGSGASFDTALLVSACGMASLLLVSYLRERYIFSYPKNNDYDTLPGLRSFYDDNRLIILVLFCMFVVFVTVSNFYLGIYQRGGIPQTELPFGMNGIYKWLLLFGMASFTALILKLESTFKQHTSLAVAIIGILEAFLSSLSLLSRGMILNIGAITYGMYKSITTYRLKTDIRFVLISMALICGLFMSSVLIVNYLRANPPSFLVSGPSAKGFIEYIGGKDRGVRLLFLDRWVGIEGVMAVVGYGEKSFSLLNEGLSEEYSLDNLTFYDSKIITSPYVDTNKSIHHYISLPGVIAFLFYSGSYLFLFIAMFVLAMIAAATEIFVYRLGGRNIILCALLSQVIAYRYAHFGYVPKQSYLLFGALYANVMIIYISNKVLYKFYSK